MDEWDSWRATRVYLDRNDCGRCVHGPNASQRSYPTDFGIAAKPEVGVVEQVNGRRRYYRSYGYPYAYYPSAWGYYCPPRAYAPIYPEYARGVPFRCCRPYYAPYY